MPVESLQATIQALGLPVLFGVFVLKGALVGKVFPTSVFLPGYVVASGVTLAGAVVVVVLVTIAHIIGQLAVYAGIERHGHAFLGSIPYADFDADSERYRRLDRWFERHGAVAIVGTNVVPWSRGVIAIPAALSSYPMTRYACHVSAATLVYHSLYVGAAVAGLAILA